MVCCIHLGEAGDKLVAHSLHYIWIREVNVIIFMPIIAT